MMQVDLATTHAIVRLGDATAVIGGAVAGLVNMVATDPNPDAADANLAMIEDYANQAAAAATDLVERIAQARLGIEVERIEMERR